MEFSKVQTSKRAARVERSAERYMDQLVRSADRIKSRAGLEGRKARYDDVQYEFVGGEGEKIRKRHYDKSLRHLWKAQKEAPFLSFEDCSKAERDLFGMALRNLTEEEQAARKRIAMPEYKALLDREYTRREKQAIVNILSAIGHGEAYAWLVSAELLGEVDSTGARAALTMQVFEEAKHFVVLRELLRAFDVPIPRQSAWEYLFLEGVYKADGLEKFFGMNVAVEGVALSLFGMLSQLPGLEVLRLFHLDESRHTALPSSYFDEFPMTSWEKHNPASRWRRLKMILPALMLVIHLEEDLAEIGVDAFEFGGSVLWKVTFLAQRSGFYMLLPRSVLLPLLNEAFNGYCRLTREGHRRQAFMEVDSTVGRRERAVEAAVFGLA